MTRPNARPTSMTGTVDASLAILSRVIWVLMGIAALGVGMLIARA